MKLNMLTRAVFLLYPLLITAVQAQDETPQPVFMEAEVLAVYPHDEKAFTQGLVYEDGMLLEGTGRNGESGIREIELSTGRIIRREDLDRQYFGEGITVLNDHIYQLTWRANTGFIYDMDFNLTGSFLYSGEGWGLTDDGSQLIMSDGSSTLRFIDPQSLTVTRRVEVTFQGNPVPNINELEYIDGEVWANVWYQDALIRIDPESGVVTSVVDLASLYPDHPRDSVLNGIAWDEENGRLFVTGKLWPSLFEIRVLSQEP